MKTEMNAPSNLLHSLGALQKELHTRWITLLAGVFTSTLCFLFAGTAIIIIQRKGLPAHGNGLIPQSVYIIFSIFLFLGLGGYFFWNMLQQCGVRLQVFEEGLVYLRKGKMKNFRWDEIEQVWVEAVDVSINLIPAGKLRRYILKKSNGERIVLTKALKGLEEIAGRILEETGRVLLPRAIEAINIGKSIAFGKFIVTREGISNQSHRLAWAEIKEIGLHRGIIRIYKQGAWVAWAKFNYSSIPNAHVFLALAEQLLQG